MTDETLEQGGLFKGDEVDLDRMAEEIVRLKALPGTTVLKPWGGAVVRGVSLGRRVRPSWGGKLEPLQSELFPDGTEQFRCGR